MDLIPSKYPKTPYWPDSLSTNFINRRIVITEKLDGGNTCLYKGQTYSRTVTYPTNNKWLSMVKKYHAWKSNYPIYRDLTFYGEDIYAIHSIKYNPIKESDTFYLFAIKDKDYFLSWDTIRNQTDFLVVPEVFDGVFFNVKHLTNFLIKQLGTPSALGKEKEGFVIRIFDKFLYKDFDKYVCKFVRPNHNQITLYWRSKWEKAAIKK